MQVKAALIVFRQVGYLFARERWTYISVLMPAVDGYCLGVRFLQTLVLPQRAVTLQVKQRMWC